MKRRQVLTLLALGLAETALAQRSAAERRIAFIHSAIPADQLTVPAGPFWVRRFLQDLKGLGDVEGVNVVIDRYSAEGDPSRFMGLVSRVIDRRPDLIVTNLNSLVAAFMHATSTIPIVGITQDPVAAGLVTNLARPAGNFTGVSIDAGVDLIGLRVALLLQVVPSVRRVGAFLSPGEWDGQPGQELRRTAGILGIALEPVTLAAANPTAVSEAFVGLRGHGVEAVIISPSGDFLAHRTQIVALTHDNRLPAIYPYRDYVELGGLLSYGPKLDEMASRLAAQVHGILAGARPGDLPIFQASRFELVINLTTSSMLGIEVPALVLARTDEIVE